MLKEKKEPVAIWNADTLADSIVLLRVTSLLLRPRIPEQTKIETINMWFRTT